MLHCGRPRFPAAPAPRVSGFRRDRAGLAALGADGRLVRFTSDAPGSLATHTVAVPPGPPVTGGVANFDASLAYGDSDVLTSLEPGIVATTDVDVDACLDVTSDGRAFAVLRTGGATALHGLAIER